MCPTALLTSELLLSSSARPSTVEEIYNQGIVNINETFLSTVEQENEVDIFVDIKGIKQQFSALLTARMR